MIKNIFVNIKTDIEWATETTQTFNGTWSANVPDPNPIWAEIPDAE